MRIAHGTRHLPGASTASERRCGVAASEWPHGPQQPGSTRGRSQAVAWTPCAWQGLNWLFKVIPKLLLNTQRGGQGGAEPDFLPGTSFLKLSTKESLIRS